MGQSCLKKKEGSSTLLGLAIKLNNQPAKTLRRPLILTSRRLVFAMPLNTPPSNRLVVSSSCCAASHCLVASAGCRTIHLLSSSCCTWLLSCLSSCTALLSSHHSPSPTPSNAVKRCCRHRIPPPPPSLKAVSIVHPCHSCHPLPVSRMSMPTFVHCRPQTLTPTVATRTAIAVKRCRCH